LNEVVVKDEADLSVGLEVGSKMEEGLDSGESGRLRWMWGGGPSRMPMVLSLKAGVSGGDRGPLACNDPVWFGGDDLSIVLAGEST
jgi:hypothetical protein